MEYHSFNPSGAEQMASDDQQLSLQVVTDRISIGEVYRLVQSINKRIDDLANRLENRTVSLEMYQLSHSQLVDRVANLEKENKLREEQNRSAKIGLLTAIVAGVIGSCGSITAILVNLLH